MYAADGGTRQNSGVLRIASSVLHILPQTTVAPDSGAPAALVIGQKAAQERFSEESFRYFTYLLTTSPETHFSKALPKVPAHSTGTHGTQQAWINSRTLTNIATGWKHRQPIFLHPTSRNRSDPAKPRQLAESVSILYTKSFPFQ